MFALIKSNCDSFHLKTLWLQDDILCCMHVGMGGTICTVVPSLPPHRSITIAFTRGSTFRKLQGSKIAYSLINIYTFGVI